MDCSLLTCEGSTSTTAPDGAGSGLQSGCARAAAGTAKKARAAAMATTDRVRKSATCFLQPGIRAYPHFGGAQSLAIVIEALSTTRLVREKMK